MIIQDHTYLYASERFDIMTQYTADTSQLIKELAPYHGH